jgi:Leucine-rich repeat (LRR) protein
MKKLEKINLNFNQLESISKSICDWTSLKELKMSFNSLMDLTFDP